MTTDAPWTALGRARLDLVEPDHVSQPCRNLAAPFLCKWTFFLLRTQPWLSKAAAQGAARGEDPVGALRPTGRWRAAVVRWPAAAASGGGVRRGRGAGLLMRRAAACQCFGPGGPQPTSEFVLRALDSGW